MNPETYSLSPLSTLAVLIGGFFLTMSILFLIFRQGKSIKSSDGTLFYSEVDCEKYEELMSRLSFIYEGEIDAGHVSFNQEFLSLLKNQGFSKAKQLILCSLSGIS